MGFHSFDFHPRKWNLFFFFQTGEKLDDSVIEQCMMAFK